MGCGGSLVYSTPIVRRVVGVDSHSSRHVGTLGKSFAHGCLWRFVKLRHSIRVVSGALLRSSELEEAL